MFQMQYYNFLLAFLPLIMFIISILSPRFLWFTCSKSIFLEQMMKDLECSEMWRKREPRFLDLSCILNNNRSLITLTLFQLIHSSRYAQIDHFLVLKRDYKDQLNPCCPLLPEWLLLFFEFSFIKVIFTIYSIFLALGGGLSFQPLILLPSQIAVLLAKIRGGKEKLKAAMTYLGIFPKLKRG